MSSQDGMYRLTALVKEASWSLAFEGVKFLLACSGPRTKPTILSCLEEAI